jgi:hypothetical protein
VYKLGLVVAAVCITLLITSLAYIKKNKPQAAEANQKCPVCEVCQQCPACPEPSAEAKTGAEEPAETKAEAEEEPTDPNFKDGVEGYFDGPTKVWLVNPEPVQVEDGFSLDFRDHCYLFRTQVHLVSRPGDDEVIVEVDGSSSQVPEEWAKLPNWQRTHTVCPSYARFTVPAKRWPLFVKEQKKIESEKARIRKATGSPDE